MKCTLMPGIKSVSGSIKQKNGNLIVFKTFSKPSTRRGDKSETRMYLMERRERTTPVSEKEIEVRERFKKASEFWTTMDEVTKKQFYNEWKKKNYRFNGKKYATLRGFVIAKWFALNP